MKLQLACSLVCLLCNTNAATAADSVCKTHLTNNLIPYEYIPNVTVSDLALETPEQVRSCILASLQQQREEILDSVQQKAKDLADVDALIERWKKKN